MPHPIGDPETVQSIFSQTPFLLLARATRLLPLSRISQRQNRLQQTSCTRFPDSAGSANSEAPSAQIVALDSISYFAMTSFSEPILIQRGIGQKISTPDSSQSHGIAEVGRPDPPVLRQWQSRLSRAGAKSPPGEVSPGLFFRRTASLSDLVSEILPRASTSDA